MALTSTPRHRDQRRDARVGAQHLEEACLTLTTCGHPQVRNITDGTGRLVRGWAPLICGQGQPMEFRARANSGSQSSFRNKQQLSTDCLFLTVPCLRPCLRASVR